MRLSCIQARGVDATARDDEKPCAASRVVRVSAPTNSLGSKHGGVMQKGKRRAMNAEELRNAA